MLIKFVKFTLLLLGICVLSAAPVCADTTYTFTFTATPGNLGHTANFTSGPFPLTLTATGWLGTGIPFIPLFFPGDLFAKTGSGTESGLGLAMTTDNEIFGPTFIQLNLAKLLASVSAPGQVEGVSISMTSIQHGDSYAISGGNTAGVLGPTSIASHQTAAIFPIPTSDLGLHYLDVSASTGTVLLEDVEVTTPEPSSGGLLLIGFGALVAAGAFGKKFVA